MLFVKYKYRNLKENDYLYDSYDLTDGIMVNAEYWHAGILDEPYDGNPLIEALPSEFLHIQIWKNCL